jgi:3-oxoacyl-[acyl-carrier-protein] synthase II
MAAGIQAIRDSGLEVTEANAPRIGAAIGAGIGGIYTIEQNYDAFLAKGPRKISPFFVPAAIINMASGNLSIMYGFKGPNISIVSACSTGAHNIADSVRMIQYGDADVMIAGGAEYATTPIGIGGFAAARALSTNNDDPQGASRPWDKDRDGFVLSDGAGVLVVEELEHAKARGAKIYAEIAGVAMNADAYHMTAPSPGGEGATRCMRLALSDAGADPQEVNYINAHGTSTPAGDVAETKAIKGAFGEHAGRLAISSTKSMTGHMLGAAGGAEAVFTVLAIRDQVAPPTINLENPDPECDLDYVPNTAREMEINLALSNSFGFGGTNGTLAFRRFSD